MRDAVLERGPRARRWIGLAIAAGVPLFFLRIAEEPFNVPKLWLLLSGVFLLGAVRAIESSQGASTEPLRRLAVPAVAFAAPLIVAWLFAPYRGWSLFGEYSLFQGLVPYLAVVAFGVLIADAFDADRIRSLVWAMALSGGIVGAYALVQTLGLDPFDWGFEGREETAALRAFSTLGNVNFSGSYLAMTLPAALGLWVTEPSRRKQCAALVALIAIGLVLARSLGPAAAGVAAALVFWGLTTTRFRFGRVVALVATGAAVAAVVGIVLFSMLAPDNALAPATARTRGYWWKAAGGVVAHSPIVGRGPNAFAIEAVTYRPPEDAALYGYEFSNDPHSVPLALMAGGGALAGLGFIAVAAWTVTHAANSARGHVAVAVFVAAIAAYFVQSMVSIDQISIRVTLWACLGGLAAATATAPRKVAPTRKARKKVPAGRPLRAWPALIAVVVALLGAWWWAGTILLADIRAQRGVDLFGTRQLSQAERSFDSAIDLRDDARYRRLYGFLVGEVAAPAEDPNSGGLLGDLDDVFSYLDELPDVRGMRVFADGLAAGAESGATDPQEAVAVRQRVVRLDPLDPEARADAALALLEVGRAADAAEVIEPAVKLIERFEDLTPSAVAYPVWDAAARAYAASGDIDAARDAVDRAIALGDPSPDEIKEYELLLEPDAGSQDNP